MKIYISIFAVVMTFVSTAAHAKSLVLLSKPEAQATSVATVQSGDRLIPIYTPEKSDWIKVADPKNGNVGWLKRQDLGLNQSPQMYEKRIERESGDKKKGPYRHEVYEYKGTEKLNDEQVKQMFEKIEKQQAKIHDAMRSMFNNMMNQFSDFDKMIPDFSRHFDHHYIVVPDDNFYKSAPQKNPANN